MPEAGNVLHCGVMGLGTGWSHVRGYRDNPRARVVALCDVDERRLAQGASEFGIPQRQCFTDHRQMLAVAESLGLEAVSNALPNHLHAPVSIECLQAGLHVLCEKPMAMNVAESRQMIEAAQAADRKLMINFSFRFRPESQALKRVVDEGAVGDIYFGRSVWHRRRGLPGFGGWFGQKEQAGGGSIIDLGVHRLDLALWMMGYPDPVTVSASTYSMLGSSLAKRRQVRFDVEDFGAALIRFSNGATVILEASWAGFSEKQEDMITQLLGTRGGIVQRNIREQYDFEAWVFTEMGGALWGQRLMETVAAPTTSYDEFVDAVLEDREPAASARHGLAVQQILDAVYRSASLNREVEIREL